MNRHRVFIEARLSDGLSGGVQQFVLGLAGGLSALPDQGREEYFFVADQHAERWLAPFVNPPCRIFRVQGSRGARLAANARRAIADPFTVWRKLPFISSRVLPPPTVSDGLLESAGAEVIHFAFQDAFLTRVPSIYHPHDLQHVHLPHMLDPRSCAVRERLYGAYCRSSSLVAVASSWVKRDVEAHFGLPAGKVAVVPLAPPNALYAPCSNDEIDAVRTKFALPDEFVFYPAQTWPHKNHVGLLEALASLRSRAGLTVPLVSSGHRNEHFPVVMKRAEDLGIQAQVHFVGFVSPVELQSLYRLARAVVIPSRFEAGSFPIWEAQLAGVPVACSNVTSLPVQAGDGALVFDPDRPQEIAAAVERLWTDARLRQALVQRGRENITRYSWERTARLFRAHYRRLGGWGASDEDRELLARPAVM